MGFKSRQSPGKQQAEFDNCTESSLEKYCSNWKLFLGISVENILLTRVPQHHIWRILFSFTSIWIFIFVFVKNFLQGQKGGFMKALDLYYIYQ